ncbi:MAG: hypothetical protein ACOYNC_17430 [Bacteroidales bacterium]
MLALKIDGQYIDLPDDFSFTMNLKSPLFGDVGSYSYPFRVPATPRNAMILGFPHRIENTNDLYRDMPSTFEWNGLSIFSGTARFKSINRKTYEGIVFDSNGNFYYQLQNRGLHQVDFGSMSFATECEALIYLSNAANNYYPGSILACPMIHDQTYFDPPTDNTDLQWLNFTHWMTWPVAGTGCAAVLRATSEQVPGVRTIITPMLYLRYVLDKIFEGLGYTLDDQMFSSHPDFSRLVLFNATNANCPFGSGYVPENYTLTHLYFNNHIPRVPLNDFIKGLEDYFGFGTFVDNVSRTVRLIPLKAIANSSDYIDFSKNIISCNIETEGRKKGFKLAMTIEAGDLMLEGLQGYEKMIMDIYKGSVPTIAELPPFPIGEVGTCYYVENLGQYYQMNTNYSYSQTVLMEILMTRFYFRSGEEDLTTIFSNLWSDTALNTATVNTQMTAWKAISPRLFFAAKDNWAGHPSMMGVHETVDHSLFYRWETGMYNRFWKEYLTFLVNAKTVKFQKSMDFLEFRNFDFSRKYMIGGLKYLAKSIQVTMKKDRVMPATLECLSCD